MLVPEDYDHLRHVIRHSIERDRHLLDQLRSEIAPLRAATRPVQPRQATAISLVGTDGGSNRIHFDPFLVQIVRVVDSANNHYVVDAVTAATNIDAKSAEQFDEQGRPHTPLGHMMATLGLTHLSDLSSIIRVDSSGRPATRRWIEAYRELNEWAVLLDIVRHKDFATDTLLVFDGLLRSQIFRGDLFHRLLGHIRQALEDRQRQRRQIYLVGLAKKSKVLTRYRLAMQLEDILVNPYAAYVEIPRALEVAAYERADFARGDDAILTPQQSNRFVGGKMFFVKFGRRPFDPIWPVDIFLPQVRQVDQIMSFLQADAHHGFPVPFYPLCLQRAHENAALVDFDYYLLQDQIIDSIRLLLGDESPNLDLYLMQESDPARSRYAFE